MSHQFALSADPLLDRAAINRLNARHSTGPRTPEGKTRSRGNALRHGLYAHTMAELGPWLEEDPGAFECLHARLLEQYSPEGVEEEKMVERLALLWMRLDRLSLYAQRRLLQNLTPHLSHGPLPVEGDDQPIAEEPGIALMRCEAVAAAEARLERSISRLQRDLAFLARYRQRALGDAGKNRAKQDGVMIAEDPVARPVQTPVDAPSIPVMTSGQSGVAPEPGQSGAQDPVTDPVSVPGDSGLSPYEQGLRRRLLWKPMPDALPKTGSQPTA